MSERINDHCVVLVFGPQAVQLGAGSARVGGVDFPIRACDLMGRIVEQFPTLESSIGVSRLAVNQEFVAGDSMIHAGDEVALIGLISGG